MEAQDKLWEKKTLRAFLTGAGLCREGAEVEVEPLKGGVSSDIVLVRCGVEPFVVKRALARLKVTREWVVPVSRNASEVNYLRKVARLAPRAVPKILAYDPDFGGYAMEFLDPRSYPVWKEELHQGRANPEFAERLGNIIAQIHAGTHGRKEIAAVFETGALFQALRLEPYLEATALSHPDLRTALFSLSKETSEIRLALVHGDISPKNILCGPNGPVILDAECAWYGEPAFDLAFCLNHLLLKCLWTPAAAERFLACFDALIAGYLSGVDWEPSTTIETRAARLLPALLLARVDGKSPAEYVDDSGKILIRRFAPPFILNPVATLAELRQAWSKENQID